MTLEYRRVNGLHVRAVPDRKQGRIIADVMVYNKVDDYRTAFAPGVFDESLRDHLPKMLWAHNMMEPIGRWVEVDDNSQRLRMVGELDLEMVTTLDGRELDIPAVPMAHRAWTQLQKRTIDQFSVGFLRLQDSPHRSVRGATQIDKAWLDEASPVMVGSVPGTALISTRSADVQDDAVGRRIFAMSTRRSAFGSSETRANPMGFNQYKKMGGGKSAPVDPTSGSGIVGGGSGSTAADDEGSTMNPGLLPAGVKPTTASIRNHVKKTIEGGGVSLAQKDVFTPVMVPGTKYSYGKTKSVEGTKVTVSPTRSGSSVYISYKTHSDLLAGRAALKAAGYKIGYDPPRGALGDAFSIKHPA